MKRALIAVLILFGPAPALAWIETPALEAAVAAR